MLPSRSRVTRFSGRGRSSVHSQKSTRVLGQHLQRPQRRQLGDVLFAPEHRRLRLADHLDVAERVIRVGAPEVEVVDAQRLLIAGRVRLLRDRQHRLVVVAHVVAPHLVGAVGEAARVLVVARRRAAGGPSSRRRRRPRRSRPGSSRAAPSCSTTTSVTAVPVALVLSRMARALVSSVTLGNFSAGRTPITSASDLAWTRQGNPSQSHAADARRERHVVLGQHDPARRVERPVAGPRQIVVKLLDARLVRDRRVRDRARSRAARWDPRRARRGPGRGSRRACSRARDRRRRSARPARCRPGGGARRSRARAGGRARRRTSWSRPPRSSGRPAETACLLVVPGVLARRSGSRRTRPPTFQFCLSRGSHPPRSSSRMRLPVGASSSRERAAARARADDDHVVDFSHGSSRAVAVLAALGVPKRITSLIAPFSPASTSVIFSGG